MSDKKGRTEKLGRTKRCHQLFPTQNSLIPFHLHSSLFHDGKRQRRTCRPVSKVSGSLSSSQILNKSLPLTLSAMSPENAQRRTALSRAKIMLRCKYPSAKWTRMDDIRVKTRFMRCAGLLGQWVKGTTV